MKQNDISRKTTNFFKNSINDLYKSGYFESALYNYIIAKQECDIPIAQAIMDFQRRYNLTEDMAPASTCRQVFQRQSKAARDNRERILVKLDLIDSKSEIMERLDRIDLFLKEIMLKEITANKK